MNKAVFIDKDGTLIRDIPYNVNPDQIYLEDHALEGLYLLQEQKYKLIIVSNQPGIALGYFSEAELNRAIEKIRLLLLERQISLNGFYYCPHFPESFQNNGFPKCECRKPKAGMILKAAKDLEIELSQSWLIGDILNDVEAGRRAGCKTILIDNGNETEWMVNEQRSPDYKAYHLKDAAEYILNSSETFV